jgi:hypothetical protein
LLSAAAAEDEEASATGQRVVVEVTNLVTYRVEELFVDCSVAEETSPPSSPTVPAVTAAARVSVEAEAAEAVLHPWLAGVSTTAAEV